MSQQKKVQIENELKNLEIQKEQLSSNTSVSDNYKINFQKFEDNLSQKNSNLLIQNQITNIETYKTLNKPKRRNLSSVQRLQQVRLVAANFIEYGLNFRRFNQSYPHIESKFYRNTVQAVNNTAINQMQKFLRYECNIQIQKLNRDQKRSIRTQLTRVREWLGKKDMGQLQTWYKIIQRKYQLVGVQISIQEAIKLYKTLLQIVKSPFVDVMQDDIKPQTLDPQSGKLINKSERQNQERTLIFLYLQYKNLTKVSDSLCEKFGYTLRWSKHAVKQKIKNLLKLSIKKLIGSVEAYNKQLKLFFSQSDECISVLLKSENSLNLRFFLLSFYLQKTISLIELKQYVKNMNKFFIAEYKNHGQYQYKKYQQKILIPKLQEKQQQSKKDQIKNQKSQQTDQKKGEYQKSQIKTENIQIPNRILNQEKQENNQTQLETVLKYQQFFCRQQIQTKQIKIKLQN